jgi:phage baseplate assembly protein W
MATQQTFQRKEIFKDFDLSFSRHPLTNDIAVKTDVNAINQSIKSLLNTNFYERSFRPNIGSNIRKILFEPADPITINDLRQAIKETIINYEPRVNLLNTVVVDRSERNSYEIFITYSVIFKDQPIELSVVLERLR